MNKLLTTLGAITLLSTGASPLAIFINNHNVAITPQQQANAIKNKIMNHDLFVPAGTPTSTANPKTIQIIKSVLKDTNPDLTTFDLGKITFSNTTLIKGVPVNVKVIITVQSATANTFLNLTLSTNKHNQSTVKPHHKFDLWNLSTWGVKQKQIIVKSYISCAKWFYSHQSKDWDDWINNTDPNINETSSLQGGFDLINRAFSLKPDDGQKQPHVKYDAEFTTSPTPSYSSDLVKDFAQGVHYYVRAISTSAFRGQINFIVKGNIKPTPPSPQQKANAIRDKITDVDLTVPAGTNPSTTNPQTITAIKTVLKADNPSLTYDDLAKITFNNVTLTPGIAVNVIATITVGQATATKTLNVTLAQTDQQKDKY